ncbi:Tad domain-containing protein [Pseudomonas sp. MAFF 302030]|jgi:hypothetical protein|uniref:Tad domain-containing protein n=1 Tax=Pseudomonas morbosilactucae TaxID=2938197 RepID=A0A9X1YWE4_9PSED|nr:Tad domain-containing protein [Pseudomonas morbosilactucae]MCK9799347.1 Tad domain-containing protein [Pseudomonas morbosilactucae]WEK07586.1 MAG: Tad domain-containing protein [Pseudomonas sp.]
MTRRYQRLVAGLRRQAARLAVEEHGGVAPFMVLAIGGALLATAYAIDLARMTNNAAQIKRATDAAAIAIGNQLLMDSRSTPEQLSKMAWGYVQNNLGMDSDLFEQITYDSMKVTRGGGGDSPVTLRVDINLQAQAALIGGGAVQQQVHSTSEVLSRPTEVALILPTTLSETEPDLAALRRLGKSLADNLLGEDGEQDESNKVWLSLIPYSQAVNVYDAKDPQRINRWAAPGALNPVELRSLFRTGYASLADRRIPDRRANLLCMYRGLGLGQNYYWDQPPEGQFKVYYRHDLPENGSPGAPAISWRGPNPDFGQADGVVDTRWMVADKGCPNAALLPLTQDREKIDQRLDQLSTRFNTNYAIAMGWAAMSLSPNMRGLNGWGDSERPLDFNQDGNADNVKIIVMLANTTGNWFDTDAYNSEVGQAIDGQSNTTSANDVAGRRFQRLCDSFRARNLKFYFIGVRPGDPKDFGRQLFDKVASPGLRICTNGEQNMVFADAENFADGEREINGLLQDIADKIKHERYARLIE